MSKTLSIEITKYDLEALKQGLVSIGVDIKDISDEELAKMFSFALGYVDYTDEKIVRELVSVFGVIRERE